VFIRDDHAEAERVFHEAFERNRIARHWENQPVGTVDEIVDMLAPKVKLGYRHLVAGVPAVYDEESMTRFATEVKPRLEQL
jgi:hypothetical protein